MKALIQELVEAYGPSGNEGGVREIIRGHVEPLCDEMRTDALGNLIALKKGDGTGIKVMLAANYFDVGKVNAVARRVGAIPVIISLAPGGEKGMDSFFDQFDIWLERLVNAYQKAGS